MHGVDSADSCGGQKATPIGVSLGPAPRVEGRREKTTDPIPLNLAAPGGATTRTRSGARARIPLPHTYTPTSSLLFVQQINKFAPATGRGTDHYCEYCGVWLKNHPRVVLMHEQAAPHKAAVAKST